MSDTGSETPDSRPSKNPHSHQSHGRLEERTALVKREVEAARTASDAKTIRLKALRLAKEALDESMAEAAPAKPSPRSKTKSL